MAKAPPTKAEWHAFYARFNRLIALYIDSDSEAGKLVRHLDAEMDSLFTFLLEEGVEPTNNEAERVLRPAVLWRKGSFGVQSLSGARWVERILTVLATAAKRQTPVLAYLRSVSMARLHGFRSPSLITT